MIYLLIGSLTGLLIGTVGVGGILLTPMLVYLAGMDLHLALATSSFSFLFTGISGTLAYARRGTISWPIVGWLSLGIMPASLIGARVNIGLSSGLLTFILALLIMSAGVYSLLGRSGNEKVGSQVDRFGFSLMGAGLGFGSALTGTGGPVLWLPLATLLNLPARLAVGVSQALQLPISLFATFGFYLFGRIDFELGFLLGTVQALAVIIGAQLAHIVPADWLRRMVAGALVLAGLMMVVRTILEG